jgi:ribosomal protein S2
VTGAGVALVMLVPTCYLPPVNAPIVDPFRAPACVFCAGNRGLEYEVAPGTPVIAAAPGVVRFSGVVAGVRYLVVGQTDGRAATYSRLGVALAALGTAVRQGDVLATTSDRFFFGLREGQLRRSAPFLGHARFRLRPVLIGSWPKRRAPPPVMVLSVVVKGCDNMPNRPSTGGLLHVSRFACGRLGARSVTPSTAEKESTIMAVVTMRQMLEAGVHFGHQTRRWNPKMKRFIFGERNGIYIIDLEQTLTRVETAYNFVRDLSAQGGTVLFIGTKKQAQDPVRSYAEKCGMSYVNERWLGGMLTNFETIAKRVSKMQEYERMRTSGEFDSMPKKEALLLGRELEKLQKNLGGIRNMSKRPDAVFVLDTKKEHIAVTEAN